MAKKADEAKKAEDTKKAEEAKKATEAKKEGAKEEDTKKGEEAKGDAQKAEDEKKAEEAKKAEEEKKEDHKKKAEGASPEGSTETGGQAAKETEVWYGWGRQTTVNLWGRQTTLNLRDADQIQNQKCCSNSTLGQKTGEGRCRKRTKAFRCPCKIHAVLPQHPKPDPYLSNTIN